MRVTLQVSILFAIGILLVATVLIIVGYTYQQNSRAVLELSRDLVEQVTETVIERTTNYLQPAATLAQANASLPGLHSQSLVDNEALEAYAIEVLGLYPQLSGWFIGNHEGDFFFAKRFPGQGIGTQVIDRSPTGATRVWTYRDVDGEVTGQETTENVAYDPRQRPWYRGAVERNGLHWTDVYVFFTDKKPGITAAYPRTVSRNINATNANADHTSSQRAPGSQASIANSAIPAQHSNANDDSDGRAGLVVGADVVLDELSLFLSRQKIGDNGIAFIFDDDGRVIAYPNMKLKSSGTGKPGLLHMLEVDAGAVQDAFRRYRQDLKPQFGFDHAGSAHMASFTPFPSTFGKTWTIGVVVPEDDFVGAVKRTNEISLFISVAILAIAMVLAALIARSISRPISRLTDETRRIKDFDLDGEEISDSSISEVRDLSESIHAMKSGLRSFKRYVPEELVRELIETGADAQVGGEQRELTILFSDVVEFTSIAEQASPSELMSQLSEYLGLMARQVRDEAGTVDKYMGDGLMAFWGAPIERRDHARRACLAALKCQQMCDRLNDDWRLAGKPIFRTRIGIHTGDALVGNIGSEERMNYTVLGDAVNIASRLEGANKAYGTRVIISEATRLALTEEFVCRPLGRARVKGKTMGVMLFELVGLTTILSAEERQAAVDFSVAVGAYHLRQWPEALDKFRVLARRNPHDPVTALYVQRCANRIDNAANDESDGTVDLGPNLTLTA